MSAQRAREARKLITDLGPAFVKVEGSRDMCAQLKEKLAIREEAAKAEQERQLEIEKENCQLRAQLKALKREKLLEEEKRASEVQDEPVETCKVLEQNEADIQMKAEALLKGMLQEVSADGHSTSTDEPVETCKVLEQNEADIQMKAEALLKGMLQEVSADGHSGFKENRVAGSP